MEPRLSWLFASAVCCTLVLLLSCGGRQVFQDRKTLLRFEAGIGLAFAGAGCASASLWGLSTCLNLAGGMLGAFFLLMLLLLLLKVFGFFDLDECFSALFALPLVFLGLAILGAVGGAIYAVVVLLQGATDPIRSWGILLLCVALMEVGWCYLKLFAYGCS